MIQGLVNIGKGIDIIMLGLVWMLDLILAKVIWKGIVIKDQILVLHFNYLLAHKNIEFNIDFQLSKENILLNLCLLLLLGINRLIALFFDNYCVISFNFII